MVDGPVIHGSINILNGRGEMPGVDSGTMGSKVRRNEASAFSCLTVNAMLYID